MDLFDKFINVIAEFENENVEYILIGGFAVVLHGFPRLTQDIDFFIRPAEKNIEKLKQALQNVFHDPFIDEISLEELHHYPVIRYGTPDGFSIDIMIHIGEAFVFNDIQYEKRKIEGQTVRIATLKSLLKMKENTFREIDRLDVNFLRKKIEKGEKDDD